MLAALLLCACAAGLELPPELSLLQPYSVESASKEWRFDVEPSHRDGSGASTVRATRAGTLAYEKTLSFTLEVATVTDDGYAVGLGRTSRGMFGGGELVIGVVGPDGRVVRDERYERTCSRFIHAEANPNVTFLLVGPSEEWFVIAVADPDLDRGVETWWRYPIRKDGPRVLLSPGSALGDEEAERLFTLDAVAVPGTPWILVHWCRFERRGDDSAVGAVYSLMDGDAAVAWKLSLPEDYEAPGRPYSGLASVARRLGGLLDVGERTFALWHATEGARVEYRVDADADADPRVVEVGRRPIDRAEPPGAPDAPPTRRLVASVERTLIARTEASPLRDLADFGFDTDGLPIAVRRDGPSRYTSVLFSPRGTPAREVAWDPIAEPMASGSVEIHALRAAEWLVSAREYGDGGEGAWFVADAKTGTLRRLPGMDDVRAGGVPPDAVAADGTEDGGFVALIRFHMRSTFVDSLVRCTSDGRTLWSICDDHEDPTKLFGAEDVAVLADGRIAVLETIPEKVKLFSPNGEWLRTIDLESAFGQEPHYLASIGADPMGGFLIEDFRGVPPLWRLSGDGEVSARFTPTLPTGHAPEVLSRHARPGPVGAIWTRDSGAVYALDEHGVVARTFGARPSDDRLEAHDARCVGIDGLGRTWIRDRRSGSLFGFDMDGTEAFVARFAPEDGDGVGGPSITARPDGGVLVSRRECVVRFDGDGRRIGHAPTVEGLVDLELPGERFVCVGDRLRIVDAAGSELSTLERRPDGRWWDVPSYVACSADGRVALLDGDLLLDVEGDLVLLDDDGRPERIVPCDGIDDIIEIQLSLNGGHALVSGWSPDAMLYSFADERWERVSVADPDEHITWTMGLSPDGEEIIAVDSASLTLRRYPLR